MANKVEEIYDQLVESIPINIRGDCGVIIWSNSDGLLQPSNPHLCERFWPRDRCKFYTDFSVWLEHLKNEKAERAAAAKPLLLKVVEERKSPSWIRWRSGVAYLFGDNGRWIKSHDPGYYPNDPEKLGLDLQRIECINSHILVMFYWKCERDPIIESEFFSGKKWVKLDISLRELDSASMISTGNKFIAKSSKSMEVIRYASLYAKGRNPILITGKTGVGKELIAKFIHDESGLTGKYVTVNCATLGTLADAQLFGVIKGSYTGATENKDGYFISANGGTLFLDELGELSLEVQAKLLRAVANSEVTPVGSTEVIKHSARLIFATNDNLEQKVKNKEFREDLYYRIIALLIEIVPLNQRPEDLDALITHFSDGKKIQGDLRKMLLEYSWPGNVRELENAFIRAIILCNGNDRNEFVLDDFPHCICSTSADLESIGEDGVEEDHLDFGRYKIIFSKTKGKLSKLAEELGSEEEAKRIIKSITKYHKGVLTDICSSIKLNQATWKKLYKDATGQEIRECFETSKYQKKSHKSSVAGSHATNPRRPGSQG